MVAVVSLALIACGGGESEDGTETPATGDTPVGAETPAGDEESRLVVASVTTPPTIDSEFYSGSPQSWEIGANLYDALFGYEGMGVDKVENRTLDYEAITGRLVEEAELADDGVTWTLHLRQGVMSAAGNEMTAEDVKYSFDRAFGINATGAFLCATFNLTKAENVRVIDTYTVEIELDAYSPVFKQVNTLYYPAILDSKVVKEHETADDPWVQEWVATNSAGFGPYYVTEFTAGKQLVLKANPNYWEGEVPIDEVIYRSVPDASARLSLLRQGDVDVALVLSPEQLDTIKDAPGIEIQQQKPSTTFIAIAMNPNIEPFDDVRVRRALSYAIPYDEIHDDVYKGFAAEPDSFVPSNFPDHTGEYWVYEYDLDKAQQLLEEAGYGDGFDVTLTFAEFTPAEKNVAIALQTAFKKIGVNLTINIVSPAVHQKAFVDRSEPMIMYTAQSHIFDSVYAVQIYLGSGAASYLNAGDYVNPELDDLLAEGASEQDPEKRAEITREIQELVADDAPWLLAAIEDYVIATRDNVKGFAWMPDCGLRFFFLWKE
jgi:peptide/nickel transport system substrate-binding protein